VSDSAANFNLTIGAASLFLPNDEPVALGGTVAYTGDRLFCGVTSAGNVLTFHVTDVPTHDMLKAVEPNGEAQQIAGVAGGPFTQALISVTSKGVTVSSSAPHEIVYGGGAIRFHLRFNPDTQRGAIYIDENPDAAAGADNVRAGAGVNLRAEAAPGKRAVPPSALTFVAIRDDAVASVPFEAVFIHNRIQIPSNAAKAAAGSLTAKRADDAGGEVGPMGFQIPG